MRLLAVILTALWAVTAVNIATAYRPGGPIDVLVALACWPLHRMSVRGFKTALGESGKALWGAAVALLFAVPMVRIFIQSDVNAADLSSMPQELAGAVAEVAGRGWPAFSAVIGLPRGIGTGGSARSGSGRAALGCGNARS